MRVPLTLHQLEAFSRVAELRSFRKAAEVLHISQPALSRTISGAEAALGTRLFDRNTRNVRPTAAGDELAPIARRILAEFESSLGELSQFLEGRRGRVVMATLPSVGASFLPPVMTKFAALYPGVDFVIRVMTTKPVLAAVDSGDADFGICMEPSLDNNFRYTHLVEDAFVLVCHPSHELVQQPSWGWDVFTRYPYIAQAAGTSIRMLTEAVFDAQGLVVHMAYDCDSLSLSGKLVAANLGITTLPRLALSHTDTSGLAILKLDGPSLQRRLGVVTRAGRSPSTATANFLKLLKSHVAET
jgi:DNA-binding transcriptional LysR family regulator